MTTLYRPHEGRKIAGVCAGLGRRFDVSPNLFRFIAILFLFLLPGSSVLAYAILWILMPDEEKVQRPQTPPPPSGPHSAA